MEKEKYNRAEIANSAEIDNEFLKRIRDDIISLAARAEEGKEGSSKADEEHLDEQSYDLEQAKRYIGFAMKHLYSVIEEGRAEDE